jgi:hypothetical protein
VLQGSSARNDAYEEGDVVTSSVEAVRGSYEDRSAGAGPVLTNCGYVRSRLDDIELEVTVRTHHTHIRTSTVHSAHFWWERGSCNTQHQSQRQRFHPKQNPASKPILHGSMHPCSTHQRPTKPF